MTIQDGRWGREVVGTASGVVRFIGVDGYRWMIRCVVNGSIESIDALTEQARNALLDTVIRRGDTPLPVRTPLPVELPEPMASQLREAAAAQGAAMSSLSSNGGRRRQRETVAARASQRLRFGDATAARHRRLASYIERRQAGGAQRGRVRADLVQGDGAQRRVRRCGGPFRPTAIGWIGSSSAAATPSGVVSRLKFRGRRSDVAGRLIHGVGQMRPLAEP